MLTLSNIPGLIDQPETQLAAGQGVFDWRLMKAAQNARHGIQKAELFYQEASDGDTVDLPVSRVTGKQFLARECIQIWSYRATTNPTTGKCSQSGGQLQQWCYVDPQTRTARSTITYYVQGGQQNDAADGLLGVWTVGIPGRGKLRMASSPSYSPLSSANFSQDAALTEALAQQINKNARFAACSFEVFVDCGNTSAQTWQAGHNYAAGALVKPTAAAANGHWYKCLYAGQSGAREPEWGGWGQQTTDDTVTWVEAGFGYKYNDVVPQCVSSFDGYGYTTANDTIVHWPFWVYTGAADRSGSGNVSGRIRHMQLPNIDPAAPVVQPYISYWDGSHEGGAPDGIYNGVVGIVSFCLRGMGTGRTLANSFVDQSDLVFFSGATLDDAPVQQLVKNIELAKLRPEVCASTQNNAATVAPFTSPVDPYNYSRPEIDCIFGIKNTGTGLGAVRSENVGVSPTTGLVSLSVLFNVDGGGTSIQTNGSVRVLQFGRRLHVGDSFVSDVQNNPGDGLQSSSGLNPNVGSNYTNQATVDSVDAGSDVTIRVYGATGGPGTAWSRPVGSQVVSYPATSLYHYSYSTTYWIVYDLDAQIYRVLTDSLSALNDRYVFAGKITTVASGGTGGTAGGGGVMGGGGGRLYLEMEA